MKSFLVPTISFALLNLLVSCSSSSTSQESVKIASSSENATEAQPLLFGFNLELMLEVVYKGLDFNDPYMHEIAQEMQHRLVRFPGGTTANYYRWRDDAYAEAVGDITGWAGEHVDRFRATGKTLGLANFIDYTNQNKITPVFVYNIWEGPPSDVCAFVDHVSSLGGQVEYIEFNNEVYWDPRSLNNVAPYLEKARATAAALRACHPNVQIGINFAPFGNQANYEENWNAPLMEEPFFDAVVHHEYHGKQGLAMEESVATTLQDFVYPETALDHMLEELHKEAPGYPVWLTEYNIGWKHLDQWAYTGAHGMYIASVFTWLCEQGDTFKLANFHQLYQIGFGTFFLEDETLEPHKGASFFIWKLVGAASKGAETVYPVETGNRDLKAIAYDSGDAVTYLVTNKSDEAITITLSHLGESLNEKWSGSQIQYEDLTTKLPYDHDTTVTISGEGPTVEIPPYSVGSYRYVK